MSQKRNVVMVEFFNGFVPKSEQLDQILVSVILCKYIIYIKYIYYIYIESRKTVHLIRHSQADHRPYKHLCSAN